MNIPDGLYYSESHEWLKKNDDGTGLIGITDYAQSALGDIVYVEFTLDVKDQVGKGDSMCEVESVKAVESAYAPISFTVLEINTAIEDDYSVINKDPYGEGWLLKVKIDDPEEVSTLIGKEQYSKIVKELEDCD